MNVSLTARHCELTPGVRSHAEERVERFGKYGAELLTAHLVLEVQKSRKIVEVSVHARQGDFTAKAESHDMRESIDDACEKVEKQIRRKARKNRTHHGNGEAKEGFQVGDTRIESERRSREMMSVAEATDRVEEGEELVVFADTDSGTTRIVYRRGDGSVKLIEVAD